MTTEITDLETPLVADDRLEISADELNETILRLKRTAPPRSDEFWQGFRDGKRWARERTTLGDLKRIGESTGSIGLGGIADASRCDRYSHGFNYPAIGGWLQRAFGWQHRELTDFIGSERWPENRSDWCSGFLMSVRRIWARVQDHV